MPSLRRLSLALATLTTGLAAGFFYAYACSVTLGLALLPDDRYVAAMQAINATVRNGVFALSFFGALLCLALAFTAHLSTWPSGRAKLSLLALALYGLGGFALTLGVNVPLNQELARVGADASPEVLAQARADYEGPWNLWNAARAVFSTAAFAALIGAWTTEQRSAATPSEAP